MEQRRREFTRWLALIRHTKRLQTEVGVFSDFRCRVDPDRDVAHEQ